jgi:hypothetical protein
MSESLSGVAHPLEGTQPSAGSTDKCEGPAAVDAETLRSGVMRLSQAWHAYLERGVMDVSVTSTVT